MTSYSATQKGLVMGAIANIEAILAQGESLDDSQRGQIVEDCERILQLFGESGQRELDQGETVQNLLSGINAMLGMADHERRQLNAIEIPIVVDHVQALIGYYSMPGSGQK